MRRFDRLVPVNYRKDQETRRDDQNTAYKNQLRGHLRDPFDGRSDRAAYGASTASLALRQAAYGMAGRYVYHSPGACARTGCPSISLETITSEIPEKEL
jgi:hypothetical protein